MAVIKIMGAKSLIEPSTIPYSQLSTFVPGSEKMSVCTAR